MSVTDLQRKDIERNAARIVVVAAAVEALGKLALKTRGMGRLRPQEQLDAQDALFAALEMLNDEKETYTDGK